jgi:hypothetical protein
MATTNRGKLLAALVFVATTWFAAPAQAAGHKLVVRIIHAHNKGQSVDAKIKDLAKDLAQLKFSSYELKDEATFDLDTGAVGRMQLPSKRWMTVTPLVLESDGKLKLDFEVKELKFKTTVGLAAGATLAVGGPAYEDGALILAVTRVQR